MKKILYLLVFFLANQILALGQQYYFPPTNNDTWDVVTPQSLGWCEDKLDSVYKYLESKDTKGFIILKGGKIAAEKYFGNFTKDSIWYWASVGKSLTSVLIGIAQQEGKVNINNPVSTYIGQGWTNATTEQEDKITVKHLLKMTSGLNEFLLPDPNCTEPKCFRYKADPDTRWAYHSGAYYMLHTVIDSTTGLTLNQYTNQKIGNVTGMQGLWAGTLFLSRARDMARFGSLILNKGTWNNTPVLTDSSYYNAMLNTSQSFNLAYGYLWWLNGKASYKTPLVQKDNNGKLVPNAPNDMYAGMGKNEQRVYIVPSTDMVVVRIGEATGQPSLAIASFDNEIWGLLNEVFCNKVSVNEIDKNSNRVYPNPTDYDITIDTEKETDVEIFSVTGKRVLQQKIYSTQKIDISSLSKGIYTVKLTNKHSVVITKVIKK